MTKREVLWCEILECVRDMEGIRNRGERQLTEEELERLEGYYAEMDSLQQEEAREEAEALDADDGVIDMAS